MSKVVGDKPPDSRNSRQVGKRDRSSWFASARAAEPLFVQER